METPQSTSLIQGWSFRILLFAMAMSCFLSVGPAVHRRLTLSMKGVPASIELDRTTQSLPSEWSTSDGQPRAMFRTKIQPDEDREFSADLYLTREVVESLLRGEKRAIVFARNNPRMFRLVEDPPNSIPVGWPAIGFGLLGLFLYSLRLR